MLPQKLWALVAILAITIGDYALIMSELDPEIIITAATALTAILFGFLGYKVHETRVNVKIS